MGQEAVEYGGQMGRCGERISDDERSAADDTVGHHAALARVGPEVSRTAGSRVAGKVAYAVRAMGVEQPAGQSTGRVLVHGPLRPSG
jgi:hypothetical protein